MSETPTTGGDSSPNGSGFLPPGLESAGTGSSELNYQQVLDGAQERSAASTARHLADRRAAKEFGQQETTQSIDLEASLSEAQQHLHQLRKNNASYQQIAKAEQQAYAIAEQLVSGATGDAPTNYESSVDQNDDPGDSYDGGFDAAAELNGKYSSDVVTSTLEWAASGLDRSTAEAFNDALAANDENSVAAFEQLQQIKNNPELIANEDSFSQITPELVNELQEQYGEKGRQLGLLSFGIAKGKISRGEAAKAVMRDPELAMAAMSAARSGLITLAL